MQRLIDPVSFMNKWQSHDLRYLHDYLKLKTVFISLKIMFLKLKIIETGLTRFNIILGRLQTAKTMTMTSKMRD